MGTELQTIELSTPGKDIESYLSSVHSIPILTPVQERELAQKLYDNDDLDAARQLVLAHLRFVVHISRTYSGYGLPLADIIQEGNVGLMKAVDRFDPNKGRAHKNGIVCFDFKLNFITCCIINPQIEEGLGITCVANLHPCHN